MAMKIAHGDEKKATFNEINITPLTDIFLVLLIIMMVIAPSFQSQNNNIKMPEINSGVAVEENNAIVSITKEGLMFLNDEPVTEDQLAPKLEDLTDESAEDKKVIVKADEKTKSSEIMKVMRAAQDAGYEKLVVAGEPLSKKQQEELKKKDKDKK